MMKDKGIAASFAVKLQIAKVTATACDKYLVKLERVLNLYNSYSEREREGGTSLTYLLSQVSGSAGKESACKAGDLGLIPGSGRSSEEGTGYPLQYSGLENSMNCIVRGVAKSQTRLNDFHFTSLL